MSQHTAYRLTCSHPSSRPRAGIDSGTCADIDLLTQLPDRAAALQKLDRALAASSDQMVGILLVGVGRLKLINTSFGHHAGDQMLAQIAHRLETETALDGPCTPASVARICGDEFAVIVERLAGDQSLLALAEQLQHVLSRPVMIEGHEVQVRPCIGAVVHHGQYRHADTMLRDAEAAMRRVKATAEGRVVVFDQAMHEELCRRMRIEFALRHAIARQELSVAYQPIISFATGQVARFEALVRWNHPQLGSVSPGEFVPIAEETGLILPLGEWVLRTACRQLALWRRDRFIDDSVSMSVNLSRVQMQQHDLIEMVHGAIEDAGLCPGAGDLHLEITESAIMIDPDRAVELLNTLRAGGVSISMDDFGTQYSSLACLHQFPLNTLKIDRAFIRNLADRRDYAAVVHAIITLAHNLGMSVTAEGIETPEQAVQLLTMECDHAQGYHFARPMPADQTAHYLATYTPPTLAAVAVPRVA